METVAAHKYLYEVDLADPNTAAAHVVRFVGRGKRVLDVGSGPGAITRLLKNTGGCSVVAVELDAEAARMVAPFCEQVVQHDLNDPALGAALARAGTFDAVVLADVLEHLENPWRVLAGMKALLRPNGSIVVSLPHAGHNALVASLLDADFEYRDYGLLDRTHIRFFGMRNIQSLFAGAGLSIAEAGFVTFQPEHTELAHHWLALPDAAQDALYRNRFGLVYQVVVRAVPAQPGLAGIDLLSASVPPPDPHPRRRKLVRLGRRMGRGLDAKTKARVRRVLALLRILP